MFVLQVAELGEGDDYVAFAELEGELRGGKSTLDVFIETTQRGGAAPHTLSTISCRLMMSLLPGGRRQPRKSRKLRRAGGRTWRCW